MQSSCKGTDKKYHVRNLISIHPTMERICLRYVLFHVNFNGILMQEGVVTQEKNNCCLKNVMPNLIHDI